MKRFFRNNGLSIVLALLFLGSWVAQALFGWKEYNEERGMHHREEVTLSSYLSGGHFWQATGENWESEFLQMAAYVLLTSFLYQKGSAESRDPDGSGDEPVLAGKRPGFLYRNSLSLALFLFFAISFCIHARGALIVANESRADHGLPAESAGELLAGSEFWFQSFQNWQSEFLAVLAIVTLTIFLRQEGSPESKHVLDPNSKTGR